MSKQKKGPESDVLQTSDVNTGPAVDAALIGQAELGNQESLERLSEEGGGPLGHGERDEEELPVDGEGEGEKGENGNAPSEGGGGEAAEGDETDQDGGGGGAAGGEEGKELAEGEGEGEGEATENEVQTVEGGGGGGGGGEGAGGGGGGGAAPLTATLQPTLGVAALDYSGGDLDENQGQAVTEQTGMAPEQHTAAIQAGLGGLRSMIEGMQGEVVARADQLAATVASEMTTEAGTMSGEISAAEGAISAAYESARGQLTASATSARGQIDTDAISAQATLDNSYSTQLAAMSEQYMAAQESVSAQHATWLGPFETMAQTAASDFQATADEKAGGLAGRRATITQSFAGSGDALERYKGEKRMDVAGQAVDDAVDRFKNEAPQKAAEAVASQDFNAVISGFLEPLQAQVDEIGNHGADAVQGAYDTATVQLDEEKVGALATVDEAETQGNAELNEDEATANQEVQGGGTQLGTDIQGEADSALALFTDTAATFADAYAFRVEEIRAGLPDGVFMTREQVGQYISDHTSELQGFHSDNLAQLDTLYNNAIGGLDQMVADDGLHVQTLVTDNQTEAQRIADEKCGLMEETSISFGQSMVEIGNAVDAAMLEYVAPVQEDMTAYIAECDLALSTKLTETTETLATLNNQYGVDLDGEIATAEANIRPDNATANVESELRDVCKNSYSAMRGMGTDESKLYNALRKVTTRTHGQAVRQMWGMQYPSSDSLGQWLYDDLSGSELSIAQNYLAGNTALAARMELEENMCWYGDDEAQIEAILRDLSEDDMAAMQDLDGWETTRQNLQDNLDGTDLDVTNSLLSGNTARADAYRLRDQINTARRSGDHDALHSALAGIDSNQLSTIQAEFYNINNGVTATQTDVPPVDPALATAALVTAVTEPVEVQHYDPNTGEVHTITREITGANAALATALATSGNDSMDADVARFEVERTRNGGPNEQNMETALYTSPEHQQALHSPDPAVRAQAEQVAAARAAAFRAQWEEQYGEASGFANMDAAMDAEYANADNSAIEQRVHDNMLDAGTNSADVVSDLTFLSIEGGGTDEDRLKRSYEGMRPDEVQTTRENYARDHGNGDPSALDRDLGVNEHSGWGSEVSGDDRRDMERLLLGDEQYMTDEQRLGLVNHELEWSVGEESTGFGRAIMGDSDEDSNLREHAANLQALINLVASESPTGSAYNPDGSFAGSLTQYEEYRRLCAFVGINAAHYRERQDSIASLLTTIAAVLIAAAVTFATGGAAGPAAAMWIAALTGASKIALNAAVLGGRYGWEQMVQDGAITAVEVATAGIGARLNAGGGIFRQAEGVVNARTIVGQGIVGFGTGFANSASNAAINERPDWALAGVSGGLSGGISAGVGERLNGLKLGEGRSALSQAVIAGGENAVGDAAGGSTALMFDAATGRFTGDFADGVLQVVENSAQSFIAGTLNKAAGDWGAAHGMGPDQQQNAPTEEMGTEISDADVIASAGMTEADILAAANAGLGEVGEPDLSSVQPDSDVDTGPVAYVDDAGNKAVDIDGGTAIETPDGNVVVELDSGAIAVDGGDVDSGVMPDGTQVIRDGDDAAIRHPDGTVESTIAPEGGTTRPQGDADTDTEGGYSDADRYSDELLMGALIRGETAGDITPDQVLHVMGAPDPAERARRLTEVLDNASSDVASGTASAVPGSDFHGNNRPTPEPVAVVTTANGTLGGLTGVRPNTEPHAAPGSFLVRLNDGTEMSIRVISRSMGNDPSSEVARFDVFDHSNAAVIQVSDRATDAHIERAIAHEVAEIRAVRSGATNDADVLSGGSLPNGDLALSGHDHGRVAEIDVLARQLSQAVASGGDVDGLTREFHALVDHLGLRNGDPGASERLALVEPLLSADGRSALARQSESFESLLDGGRGGEAQMLLDNIDQANAQDTAGDGHDANNPQAPRRDPIDLSGLDLSTPEGRAQAEQIARAARERRSNQTVSEIEGGATNFTDPQIGGGAALAGLRPDQLLVDDRGRWQNDASGELAQQQSQLDQLEGLGYWSPSQVTDGPDGRPPLAAVSHAQDTRAADGPVVNGQGHLVQNADGDWVIRVPGGGTDNSDLDIPFDGIPAVATGFPNDEHYPGSRSPNPADQETWHDNAWHPGMQDAAGNDVPQGDRVAVTGDVANSRDFDPLAVVPSDPSVGRDFVIAGVGGTAISAAEIILRNPAFDPRSNPGAEPVQVRMVGGEPTAGLETNPQLRQLIADFGPGGRIIDGALVFEGGGTRVDNMEIGPDGRPILNRNDGGQSSGDFVIAAIGRRNEVPGPIRDAVASFPSESCTGETLWDNHGNYVGYRVTMPDGQQIDVIGGASRFLPTDHVVFDPADVDAVNNASFESSPDAPQESGNFSGGYAPSAVQSTRYQDFREGERSGGGS